MEIGLFDAVKIVRPLIPDEVQIEEIELVEASIRFANAHNSGQESSEFEIALLNRFMRGETNPLMQRAWCAYRRRLLYHHRRES